MKLNIKKIRNKFAKSVKEFGTDQELTEGIPDNFRPEVDEAEEAKEQEGSQPVEVKDEPEEIEEESKQPSQSQEADQTVEIAQAS